MNGWLTPMEADMDTKPHRCGRCNNSTGILNPSCPNRPKTDQPAPATPIDGFFTDDEAAAILESWSQS